MIAILLNTKNEGPLLDLNLSHHLGWGIDHICVADNHSTDATAEICRSHGPAVSYQQYDDFHQRQTNRHLMLHRLMEETNGAVEWAAISDTDEFLYRATPIREILADVPAEIVAVEFRCKAVSPDRARSAKWVGDRASDLPDRRRRQPVADQLYGGKDLLPDVVAHDGSRRAQLQDPRASLPRGPARAVPARRRAGPPLHDPGRGPVRGEGGQADRVGEAARRPDQGVPVEPDPEAGTGAARMGGPVEEGLVGGLPGGR